MLSRGSWSGLIHRLGGRGRTSILLGSLLLSAGCLEQSWADYDALGSGAEDSGSTTGAATASDSGWATVSSVTITASAGDSASTSESGTSSATSTGAETDTTGESAGAPSIIGVDFSPDPIKSNGAIAVTVTAEYADGVTMELDSGEVMELVSNGDDSIYEGEALALSGFANGEHIATLTPWSEQAEGDAVEATYTIALPTPGSEALWESGSFLGKGNISAVGVLPEGQLVEFGQRWVDDSPRCYLRRRTKAGAWSENTDVKHLLPGTDCAAVDMKIDAAGSIFVLAQREENGSTVWWLGELPSWGGSLINHGLGAQGEEATALALGPSGKMAVCGAVPTGESDLKDAAAWFFGDGQTGKEPFDYRNSPDDELHKYGETTRDCVFSGSQLVMVGAAFGTFSKYPDDIIRHFILRVEAEGDEHSWTVANADIALQSSATAVSVDDEGRIITAGYGCGDPCDPAGDLRLYSPTGEFLWFAPIGDLPSAAFGPHDVEWSPAGYAVVALGGTIGDETAFSARAYEPFKISPLWTYARDDGQQLQMAFALSIGLFGQVYAGGFGSAGYPALAIIHG